VLRAQAPPASWQRPKRGGEREVDLSGRRNDGSNVTKFVIRPQKDGLCDSAAVFMHHACHPFRIERGEVVNRLKWNPVFDKKFFGSHDVLLFISGAATQSTKLQ
jgi:hypothetical protein